MEHLEKVPESQIRSFHQGHGYVVLSTNPSRPGHESGNLVFVSLHGLHKNKSKCTYTDSVSITSQFTSSTAVFFFFLISLTSVVSFFLLYLSYLSTVTWVNYMVMVRSSDLPSSIPSHRVGPTCE